jgi:GNAT superfamily N-acetyltransferase
MRRSACKTPSARGAAGKNPWDADMLVMNVITLRRLGADDSLAELTAMLHRAFARLGRMGLNCTCVDQPVAVTRQRIAQGECFVAEYSRLPVGTITLQRPDPRSESPWYRRGFVASAHQLAVDPQFQGNGLGTTLLEFAEEWARASGYRELALDTAQPASDLLRFYRAHGYRIVDSVRFPGKCYPSAVLSKAVAKRDTDPIIARRAAHSHDVSITTRRMRRRTWAWISAMVSGPTPRAS